MHRRHDEILVANHPRVVPGACRVFTHKHLPRDEPPRLATARFHFEHAAQDEEYLGIRYRMQATIPSLGNDEDAVLRCRSEAGDVVVRRRWRVLDELKVEGAVFE